MDEQEIMFIMIDDLLQVLPDVHPIIHSHHLSNGGYNIYSIVLDTMSNFLNVDNR